MAASPLSLYELIEPSLLTGLVVPSHIDAYLSFVSVDVLRATADDDAIVYFGRAHSVVTAPPGRSGSIATPAARSSIGKMSP